MNANERKAIQELAAFFDRNGYVRCPNASQHEAKGSQLYKKGYEIRLVANSRNELNRIRKFLREAGFRPGAPFAKANQFGQPIYGKEAVARFLELTKAH